MTVFVVQEQHRFDHSIGRLVPKFDLSPAEQHGRLVYLLSPTASPFSLGSVDTPGTVLAELMDKLQQFGDDDHLLLIGNPVLIGVATAIAADCNDGRVRLLQWSGKDRRYISVSASL